MKMLKKLAFTFALGLFAFSAFQTKGQVLTPEDDGVIPDPPRSHYHDRVVPYPHLRETDLQWSSRHWERIFLKEKQNFPLYYPIKSLPDRRSLYTVLVNGIIEEGTITEVFADDIFEIPLTEQEVRTYIEKIDTVYDPDDPTMIVLIDTIKINPNDVIAYDIKSDWFFDKQRGELKNRIIAISPVVRDPRTKDIYNLFWVWFPDARYALSTNVAYNMQNHQQRMTFDQFFHMRLFSSVITKEANVYDRAIKDYKKNPMDQLLEAQYIRDKLRNFEHDMWEF